MEKKPYVLTERRRAANLANLQKAWRAPKPPYRATPDRRTASLANLQKAQAANRARGYERTPRRVAANLANLQKAWAVVHDPKNYVRCYGKRVKHGYYASRLERAMKALGESPRAYEAHVRLIERAFLPQDAVERAMVGKIAEAIWRRLRIYRAQARVEAAALRHFLESLPPAERLDGDQTYALADRVISLLLSQDVLFLQSQPVLSEVERQLAILLRQRMGRDPHFRIMTYETQRELEEWEEMERTLRAQERLLEGGPEVEAILEKVMPEWWLRRQRGGNGAESHVGRDASFRDTPLSTTSPTKRRRR